VSAKCRVSCKVELGRSRPSRAVNRSRNVGTSSMLGVEADRFDHEVEFVGTVDFARDAISHVGLHALSFAEVIESVNALRVAILQQEHCMRRMFRPRE